MPLFLKLTLLGRTWCTSEMPVNDNCISTENGNKRFILVCYIF